MVLYRTARNRDRQSLILLIAMLKGTEITRAVRLTFAIALRATSVTLRVSPLLPSILPVEIVAVHVRLVVGVHLLHEGMVLHVALVVAVDHGIRA